MTEVDPVTAAPPAVYESGPARVLAHPRRHPRRHHGRKHPHAAAIDDGRRVVTYRRLHEEINARVRELTAAGIGARRPGRASGSTPARPSSTSRSSPCCTPAPRTCRSTPTTRRSAPTWSSARPTSARSSAPDGKIDGARRPHGDFGRPVPERRRLDHLHLRLDRQAEGRRGHASVGRCVRRRRSRAVPRRRTDRTAGPGAGRAVGGLRRLVRGDVAGLAQRRLPGAGAAIAGPHRRRPRPVAGRAADHRSCPRCRRWPGCGRPTRSRTYAC